MTIFQGKYHIFAKQYKRWGQHYKFCTKIMKPTKEGQFVRFHTPFKDEDPNQMFIVKEIHSDLEKPRAKIIMLNNGCMFNPVYVVLTEDIELAQPNINELKGYFLSVMTKNGNVESGQVTECSLQDEYTQISKTERGVVLNIHACIIDKNNIKHKGLLILPIG